MCNSAEVMSEEMADHLQQEEARVQKKEAAGGAGVVPSVDTSEDLTIAHLLQKQFGSEAVTFARYRLDSEHLPDNGSSEEEEEEEDYFSEDDWENYETRESGVDGVKKNGENVVSKHDKELSQRKNAKRIMECWCSSVPIVKRPMQKSSYVLRSYVGISKEMKIVENYEMKLVFLTSPP